MPHVLVLSHSQLLAGADADAVGALLDEAGVPLSSVPKGGVWRLAVPEGFRLPEGTAQALAVRRIDANIVPDKAFADLGLIVSDMDSTLITIECVDEIAAGVGLKEKVTAITERSMRGELDFEASLRERVALLKGLPESELERVYDKVLTLTDGAEFLLRECRAHGVKFMLVSGGFTFFTRRLQKRLGFEYEYANVLETASGRLTGRLEGRIIDAQAKADLLREYQAKLGLARDQVCAVGDGANDIPMLQAAGFGVAFHAKPKTQAAVGINIRFGNLEALRHLFA